MTKIQVDYHKYMASREWALKKEAVKERASSRCERCRVAPLQNIHHLSYKHLGSEPLDELQGVCRPCHAYLSAQQDDDPVLAVFYELITSNELRAYEAPDDFDDMHGSCRISGWGVTGVVNDKQLSVGFNLRSEKGILDDTEYALEVEPGIYAICWWG